jgi:hypothetical protein
MTMSNRDRVGRGLEILASGLGPFVDARMRAAVPSGSDWVGVLADRDRSRHQAVGRYSLSDPRFLLRVVTEQWQVFTDDLSRAEQGFATELRETGNRWAHGEEFSDDDAYRALDTMERLLHAVGAAEHVADVRSIRLSLQPPAPQTQAADDRAAARGRSPSPAGEDSPNWRLILEAARALTATGQSPFTRISVYQWIWQRYPRGAHDRPSLDPTFQGMIKNAAGGPPSAGGTPLLRVNRGRYVLADTGMAD